METNLYDYTAVRYDGPYDGRSYDVIRLDCKDEQNEWTIMAWCRFNLAVWEVEFYDSYEVDAQVQFATFDTYEDAMDFMAVRQVLARMS